MDLKKMYNARRIVLLLLITFSATFFSYRANCQKWSYRNGDNDFDGKYKVGYVQGSGGEFPYQSPKIYVNFFINDNDLNIYVSDAGYAGCDGKAILVKFNLDDNLYYMSASTNNESDVWFISEGNYSKPTLTIKELIEGMKKNTYMKLRLSSDCGQVDYKFSLSGSSSALDFVTKDYFKLNEENTKVKKEFDDKVSKSLEYISSGMKVYAITEHDCSVFREPNSSSLFKSLKKGERIVISEMNEEFYNIHSSVSIDFKDKLFFIRKDCIIKDSIELITGD
jgi:hypothetical protein